jgi:hypothetical protein
MKSLIKFTIIFTVTLTSLFGQKSTSKKINSTIDKPNYSIDLSPEKWAYKEGKVAFLEYKGVRAMKISPSSGQVVLKDVLFKDGTIEYDVEPIDVAPQFIYFHRQNDKEQEIFYLRGILNNPFANDAVQYAPVIEGVNMWDMYDIYQAPALIKEKEWNHIKLVMNGLRLQVFINDMSKPVLDVPKLEGNTKEGSISFDGESIVANVTLKVNETNGLPFTEAPDLTNHDANYLRKWKVSLPIPLSKGNELHNENLPKDSLFIENIVAERQGLVNLTRKFGKNEQRKVVWLKAKIISQNAQKNLIQLGFSDEVWVFVNNQRVHVDKNSYRFDNIKKNPNGRISILNTSFPIQFKKGENELLIGVANDFFGWGIIARLENLEGIELIK